MRNIAIAFMTTVALAGCGGTESSGPAPVPYVAAPLADLAAGTELVVRGNHTGWWQNHKGGLTANKSGPKLQRLDTTGVPNQYEAVFRNNDTRKNYGKATFMMPANGDTVTKTTNEGYEFSITRINDNLFYTLTGLFDIDTISGPNANREAHGGFVAGSYTPTGGLPSTGSTTYQGNFIGRSTQGEETGTAELTASWGGVGPGLGNVSGTISGITGISDFNITATITATGYKGTITADTTDPTDLFTAGTTGTIDGGFYGPAADETGATIRIEQGGELLTGAFGGACTTGCN